MDTSFSRMHVIGGLIAGAVVAAIALASPFAKQSIANPITTLTQFSKDITPASETKGAELFARTQRNAVTISILARGIKPKFTKRRRYEVPSPPRRGVPGGGS